MCQRLRIQLGPFEKKTEGKHFPSGQPVTSLGPAMSDVEHARGEPGGDGATAGTCLVVRAAGRHVALSFEDLIEVFRPLQVAALGEVPEVVRGMCRHRGEWVPVVDLAVVLGAGQAGSRMCVAVRVGDRRAALAVDGVRGLRPLPALVRPAPSLVREATAGVVRALGSLDSELLVVLEAARLVPPEAWDQLDRRREEMES